MSYKIMQVASPGKHLDGRDVRPGTRRGMPDDHTPCLVMAESNFAHHKKGDQWVEWLPVK